MERDLNAQIASGDHYACAVFGDLIDVINACTVLDLGDDFDVLAAVGIQEFTHLDHVFFSRYERSCDKIDVVLNTEQQVLLILLA